MPRPPLPRKVGGHDPPALWERRPCWHGLHAERFTLFPHVSLDYNNMSEGCLLEGVDGFAGSRYGAGRYKISVSQFPRSSRGQCARTWMSRWYSSRPLWLGQSNARSSFTSHCWVVRCSGRAGGSSLWLWTSCCSLHCRRHCWWWWWWWWWWWRSVLNTTRLVLVRVWSPDAVY